MQRVLVTGAGRGIGLAVARVYVARGDVVLAGYRSLDRAPGLQELASKHPDRVTLVPLDVSSLESVREAVATVAEATETLDVLLNNAGISPGDITVDGPDDTQVLDAQRALEFFRVNAIAPLQVAQAFLPLVRRGNTPRVVNISSGAGSLTYKTGGGLLSYSASKAALNMYTRALAWDLQGEGVTVVALDPGWARTDMGGPDAWISAEESADGVVRVIDGLTMKDTGKFFHYEGGEVPW